MRGRYKLERQFDVARLLRDLETAERVGTRLTHHTPSVHDGGWSAIPLVSVNGEQDLSALKTYKRGRFEKTSVVEECPYFNEIIDSFKCSKRRVRLMRLEPQRRVLPHQDPDQTWAMGITRIHIPIVTNDKVEFVHDGQQVVMKPGELWYLDFSQFHSVANLGDEPRVHLVLDLEVNSWLARQFPPETLGERLRNLVYRLRLKAFNCRGMWRLPRLRRRLWPL